MRDYFSHRGSMSNKGNEKLNISVLYFLKFDVRLLLLLAFTGIIFNVGLVLIPVFEGWLVQCLFDIIEENKVFADMIKLVLYYLFAMLIVQITRYLKRKYVRAIANNMVVRMRDALYIGILQKSLYNANIGELVTRASLDVEIVAEGTRKTLTEIFDTGVLLISYSAVMFYYDYKIALISLIFTPIACIIAELLKKIVYKQVSRYKMSQENLSNATFDRIINASLFRVYASDEIKNKEYEVYTRDYEKKSITANIWENTLQPIYNVIAMIGIIFIIYLGGRNFLGIGFSVWDIATFVTFINCYIKISDKSSKVARLFNVVQKAQVSWKRLKNVLVLGDGDFLQNEIEFNGEKVKLTVSDVSFGYSSDKIILENINFSATSGQIIGVTGTVASGKSSLSKLLLGELDYSGSIKINDRELKDFSEETKATYISYLGHNTELFSGSIYDNVTMGKNVDISSMLKLVEFDKEVSEMENAEYFDVGSFGDRLSGGQKSRLALARTLLHAKNIIILDDPFSAVDKKTETQILNNLKNNFKDRLIILISHRLTAFPSLDKVLFLDAGKLTESTHEDCYKNIQSYKKLYDIQVGVDNE